MAESKAQVEDKQLMKSQFLLSLEALNRRVRDQSMTLGEVFTFFGVQGHLLLILFMCLPFMQPIPLVGLSTPLGLMMVMVSILNYLGKPPWLPRRFASYPIRKDLVLNVLRVAEKIWGYVEKVLEPRLFLLFRSQFFRIFNTLIVCIQALLLCLPLPIPFSNNVPALGIALLMIGELEEDGVVVIIGYLVFILCLIFFAGIALGIESVRYLVPFAEAALL